MRHWAIASIVGAILICSLVAFVQALTHPDDAQAAAVPHHVIAMQLSNAQLIDIVGTIRARGQKVIPHWGTNNERELSLMALVVAEKLGLPNKIR